jgi:hypothetical protein
VNTETAVTLIEQDVNIASKDAIIFAQSRAQLARAVILALKGKRKEAVNILEKEAETSLIGTRIQS